MSAQEEKHAVGESPSMNRMKRSRRSASPEGRHRESGVRHDADIGDPGRVSCRRLFHGMMR